MKTRFGAAAGIVALMCSACGQREEPEPDPTANIDLPVMHNPDPSTLRDTLAVTDTAAISGAAPATGSAGIVGDDTIAGPYTPDTAGTPSPP